MTFHQILDESLTEVPPVIKVNYRKQKIKKLNHKGE
jgi:hypothetical protein